MQVSTLLADPEVISLESFVSQESVIVLRVRTVLKQAKCPLCQSISKSLHSRYIRQIADLPWHGVAVRLELHSRKFRCRNEVCRRKVFCQTILRCTPNFCAVPIIVPQPCSYSRRICSNNSTFSLLPSASHPLIRMLNRVTDCLTL